MLATQAWGPDFHTQHPYNEAKHSGLHLKLSGQGVERRGSENLPEQNWQVRVQGETSSQKTGGEQMLL